MCVVRDQRSIFEIKRAVYVESMALSRVLYNKAILIPHEKCLREEGHTNLYLRTRKSNVFSTQITV